MDDGRRVVFSKAVRELKREFGAVDGGADDFRPIEGDPLAGSELDSASAGFFTRETGRIEDGDAQAGFGEMESGERP